MIPEAFVVIMAGGTGTRFWPYSKEEQPKQFLDILGTGKSLLQMTFERFEAIVPTANIFVATNERYKDLINQQLPELQPQQLLLEPTKKNTAPCIAYACYKIGAENPNVPIIITPSDHAIFNEASFQSAIQLACKAVDLQKLITIGIEPNRPAIGYGYINYVPSENSIKKIKSFIEKPGKEQAKQFLSNGNYLWNAGIFIWSATAIKNAFALHLPEVNQLFDELSPIYNTAREQEAIKTKYLQAEEISIDYGILEKYEDVYVIPGEFDWSDLGSWASLHAYCEKDSQQNVIKGQVMAYGVDNSLILGQESKMNVIQGVKNLVVIDTPQSLLIYEKGNEKILKQAISQMKSTGKDKYL